MNQEHQIAYSVVASERGYEIRRDNGYAVLLCHSEESAQQYVTLLNQAFDAGYKAGFRKARRSFD